MKIKTYVVKRVAEAYPLIFQDLGQDAFILKTKRIRTGGFLGLFRKRRFEVVAAADGTGTKKQENLKHEESKVVLKAENHDPQHDVLRELSEVKNLIKSMNYGGGKTRAVPKPLEKWVNRLEEQEVDQDVIQYILKRAAIKHENIAQMSDREIEAVLTSVIEQLFEEGIDGELDSTTSPVFITMLGPTGVGKTTTIAKLAAARVFQQRQRVGFLTTDTFRIAAVEQLRTYANILNVPLEVVSNAEEMTAAMNALIGCPIVYMDSAGRNYLENKYIDEINQFLRYDVPQENYLVLSMTTRWRDMRVIVEQMKSVPVDKLILTKWDETTCFGAALNMVYHFPYPLAYLSIGQGVPEDILRANPSYMAKKLLGVDENAARSSLSAKTIV